MNRPREVAALAAALLVLGVAAYWPSLAGEFVYDDHRFVARNVAIRSLAAPLRFFTEPRTVDPEGGWEGIYRPLRTLSYALDHALFGSNPVGYRLHSLLLHVASSLALGVLLAGLLRRRGLAAGLAMLYAVHPVHVESVAWVTSRADLLAGLASYLCLLAMRRRGVGWRLAGLGLYAAALLGKESAVVVPLVGVLLDRVLPSRAGRTWRADLGRWSLAVPVAVAYLVVRSQVLGEAAGQRPFWGGGWEPTAATMVVGVAWYLGRLALPLGFRFDYQLPLRAGFTDPVVLGTGAVLAGAVAVLTVLMRRGRGPALGAGLWWMALGLGPVSNVIVPINIIVAERFLYLPAAGWFLALGGGVLLVVKKVPGGRWLVALGAAVWLVLLGLTTRGFAATWASEEGLWRAVVAHSPRHFRGYHGLARARLLKGDLAGGREILRRAIALGGAMYPDAYFDLGRTYVLEDRDAQAAPYLRRAVELWRRQGETARNRRFVAALEALLDVYRHLGDAREAVRMEAWLAAARSRAGRGRR